MSVRVGSPGPGRSLRLQRIRQLITDGHARLVAGGYAAAIDLFRDAAGRALQLL